MEVRSMVKTRKDVQWVTDAAKPLRTLGLWGVLND